MNQVSIYIYEKANNYDWNLTVEYASQELHSLCALTLKNVFS